MIITKLQISNIMGVEAVLIEPDGAVVKVEGKNRAGKTTTLNAIAAAIAGTKNLGKNPLRDGAKGGKIVLNLADPGAIGFDEKRDTLIVERKITPKGDKLKVSSPNGAEYKAPTYMLAGLFSAVSIDPLAFSKMSNKDRITALLALTGEGEKVEALERRRAEVYQTRHDVNRDVSEYNGKLAGIDIDPDEEPREEKSVSDAAKELSDERERIREIELIDARDAEYSQNIEDLKQQIGRIEKQISAYSDQRTTNVERRSEIDGDSRIDAFEKNLADVDSDNRIIRQSNEARNDLKKRDELKAESESLTQEIAAVDAAKVEILEGLPIKGVAIEDGVLEIDGRPYDDLSGAESIAIGVRIAAAMKPKLRVITVADGAELDSETWKDLEAYAEKKDFQIWSAVVADKPSGNGFFIEAGSVVDGS